MKKDRKKLARVIATWLVTSVMLFVFVTDMIVIAVGNSYVNRYDVKKDAPDTNYSDDKIHFLNTGNSDCIIIESNGKLALIDSGEGNKNPRKKTRYEGFEEDVINYILSFADKKTGTVVFDFVLGTHVHYDHVGGFEAIFSREDISAKKVYLKEYNSEESTDMESEDWGNKKTYENILSLLKERKIPVISDLPEEEFTFGDFTLRFLNTTTPKELLNRGENANSVGILLEKKGKTAFLASDFTRTCGLEQIYVNDIGDVDLLKIGHHGYYGTSSAFLRQIKPEIAICTNFAGKMYPNVKWNLTAVSKSAIFYTDNRDGMIAYFTDDGEILLTSHIMK